MSAEGLTATSRVGGNPPDLYLYAGLFAGAVVAFCLAQVIGNRLGLVSDLVAIAGDATCGWSWLLVRALFQPARPQRAAWPLVLVLTLVATGAGLRLWGDGAAPMLARMMDNLSGLVSSALLLLAAIEPVTGLERGMPQGERRFRIIFAAAYTGILTVAVIWVNNAPAGALASHWKLAIKSGCALLALAGMATAVEYRRRHPLPEAGRNRRRLQAAADGDLTASLRRLMTQEAVYTRQSLKVADLARRLGQPEYKVTQCITGPLGFRNFNHMANHFRIEDAKARLTDPAHGHLPILTIAFDCGFGSIGPFNRAFKAATGLTPQQFRKAGPSRDARDD